MRRRTPPRYELSLTVRLRDHTVSLRREAETLEALRVVAAEALAKLEREDDDGRRDEDRVV